MNIGPAGAAGQRASVCFLMLVPRAWWRTIISWRRVNMTTAKSAAKPSRAPGCARQG